MAIITTTDYDEIMDALLVFLRASCGDLFNYYSRRLLFWEEVAQKLTETDSAVPIRLPALFLFDGIGFGGGRISFESRSRGVPSVRIMYRTIVVYAAIPGGFTPDGPDAVTPGGTVFNPLMTAIENAFAPDSEGTLTLGGLVSHCSIEGEVHWITGEIDRQGLCMMTVPVQIMIP